MQNVIGVYNDKASLNFKIRNVLTPCLNGLNIYLKKVKTVLPDSFPTIIKYLKEFYEKIENYDVSIDSDYELLNQYPTILNGSKNHALSLVNYSKYNPTSIDDEIEIFAIDLVRAFTQFEYYITKSLLEVMSREEAIEFTKKLTDEVSISRKDTNNYVDSFIESTNRFKNNLGRWQMQDTVAGPLDEERLLYRVNRCEWADSLKNFDSELCYAFLCYGDFEGAKNMNPNFVLTRSKTLMMGDEYCDFCYHDTRKVKEITHPSDGEFEDLS